MKANLRTLAPVALVIVAFAAGYAAKHIKGPSERSVPSPSALGAVPSSSPILTVREVLADPMAYAGKRVIIVGKCVDQEQGGSLRGAGYLAPLLRFTPAARPDQTGQILAVTGTMDASDQSLHAETAVVVSEAPGLATASERLHSEELRYPAPEQPREGVHLGQ